MKIPGLNKINMKLLIIILAASLIPLASLGIITNNMVSEKLDQQMISDVNQDVVAINGLTNEHLSNLKSAITPVNQGPLVSAIEDKDYNALYAKSKEYKSKMEYIDYVAFCDADMNVISSSQGKTESLNLNSLIGSTVSSGKYMSYEIMNTETANKIDPESLISGVDGVFCAVSAVPLKANGKVEGYIVGIDFLNKDAYVLDKIQRNTHEMAELIMGNKWVALGKDSTQSLMGKTIPDSNYEKILNENSEPFKEEIAGIVYYDTIIPIKNAKNEIIGAWYVGLPAELTMQIISEIQITILIIGILNVLLTLLLALFTNRLIVRPLVSLKTNVQEFANGNHNVRANVKTGDELQELGESFNEMADNVVKLNKTLDMDKAKLAELLEEV
ncbi:cache domain-containing protein, partial [Methanococcus voltae]